MCSPPKLEINSDPALDFDKNELRMNDSSTESAFPEGVYKNNEPIKIPKNMLPVMLPEIKKFENSGNPLDQLTEWKNISINGKKYTRDRKSVV